MKKTVSFFFTVSIIIYAVMHYITYLYPSEIGSIVMGISGVIVLIASFILLPNKSLTVPLFLLVIACSIQFITGGSFIELIFEGIGQMSNLITLLLIVPVISWILRRESYIDAIMQIAQRWLNSSKKFYRT